MPPIGGFFLCVLYIYEMTSSIPDSMSFGELEAMQQEAAKRDAEREVQESIERAKASASKGPFDGKTQDEVCEIAEQHVQAAIDECNDPMVHKVMLFSMLENMIRWHTEAGLTQDDDRSRVCWLRDAGKFQAMCNILSSVSCGPNDFTIADE